MRLGLMSMLVIGLLAVGLAGCGGATSSLTGPTLTEATTDAEP
jgi:hypothetical protein